MTIFVEEAARMARTMTAATAKAHLAEALRDVESGESVTITRHGRPVAVLVPPELADQLGRLRAAGPESGLARIVGRFADGAELAEALDEVAASRTAGRSLPALD